jgi:hypothetical protein
VKWKIKMSSILFFFIKRAVGTLESLSNEELDGKFNSSLSLYYFEIRNILFNEV